ncbi:MAG: PAS domain-containing protein, partial [Nitrospirota bacterium]
DRDMKYIYVSDNYLEQYKVKEKDVIGKHHYDVFPDLPQKWRDVHQRVLAGAIERGDEDPYDREDGSVDWTRWECRPWYEYNGSIGGLIVYTEVITERVVRENALRSSEEQLRLAVYGGSVGIWEWDIATDRLEWNDQLKIIFGLPADITGLTLDKFMAAIHPEDLAGTEKAFRTALERKIEFRREYRIIWPEGSVHWIVAIGRGFYDPAGLPLRMLGCALDITERKLAEEALRISEERFRSIVSTSQEWIWAIDSSNSHTFSNPAVEKILGYHPDEIIGHDALHLLHAEDLPMVRKLVARCIKQKTGWSNLVLRWKHRDGSWRYLESNAVPMFDNTGALSGFQGSDRDITERKIAEKTLKESEDRLKEAQSIAKIGNWEYIPHSGSLWWSDETYRIFGLSPGEIAPSVTDLLKMIHPDDRETLRDQIESALPYRSDYRIFLNNKTEKYLHEEVKIEYDRDGRPIRFRGTVQDITERKQADEEKEKLQAQLLQAKKLEAVGRLAGGIAHDFNNILSAIVGYAHLMLIKMRDDDPHRLNIEHILASSEKAANLTKSLLTFSRKHIMQMRNENINDIVSGMTLILERILGEDIDLKVITAHSDLIVNADRNQLELVLMNLSANARDAMPEGGTLTITTDQTVIDDTFIRTFKLGSEGTYAVLSVVDTGTGMDKKTRENIFDPFFTTKEVGKGTGLGLAMIYGTVKDHDGFISVESDPGEGTAFRIYLPISESRGKVTAKMEPAAVRGGTETVLLVEDDEAVRNSTSGLLKAYGYTVLEAVNAKHALNLFMENREIIRLVISDMIMPGRSGIDLYNDLSREATEIKILFISGYPIDSLAVRQKLDIQATLLYKPFRPDILLNKVREILDA